MKPRKGNRGYNDWYSGENLHHVAFPMGGIGAGMICLEGTGTLSHFSIRNQPEVFHEPCIFSAVHVKTEKGKNQRATTPRQSSLRQAQDGAGQAPDTKNGIARVLEGPVPMRKVFGVPRSANGGIGKSYGLPRFASARFRSRFPFATIELKDKAVPLDVQVTGWSPFIPNDADNSSLPVAGLEYKFINRSKRKIKAVYSFNAWDCLSNKGAGFSVKSLDNGFQFETSGTKKEPWHEAAFTVQTDDKKSKTNAGWFRGMWFDPLTVAWKDVQRGACFNRPPHTEGNPNPGATLFVPFSLAPGASKTVRLRMSWYVPKTNIQLPYPTAKQVACAGTKCCKGDENVPYHTPWYAGKFSSPRKLADYWGKEYDDLRTRSAAFRDCFYDNSLPAEAVEAAAANLTILKSPTVLRQPDGKIWAWEGCHDDFGCCFGSCTHVWNYAQAIPHLFPVLEQSLRQTEFFDCQEKAGRQYFRAALPIRPGGGGTFPAADGQLGGIMKVYREWRISGNPWYLGDMWPAVKSSMDYCIRIWDPKGKGVVEEPHHNTYDIEFWGPNGMCTSFYLGALHAAILMGKGLNKNVSKYEAILKKGRAYLEGKLFNGEYFIQKIQWKGLKAKDPVKALGKGFGKGYSLEALALLSKEGPKYQYGKGCLSDGIIGAWMAEACGLPEFLSAAKVKSHLRSVHKYNLKKNLSAHANPQRPTFALGKDGGLLLCTWPKGGELSLPFVYSNEVWTGIEYQVASHLMMVGMVKEGLEIVRKCRDRYDGKTRNPYNEYECGHWYARAMASYALLQGLSGARYDAVDRVLYLHPKIKGDFRCFLSTATGYGTVGVRKGKPFFRVRQGEVDMERIDYKPRR